MEPGTVRVGLNNPGRTGGSDRGARGVWRRFRL